MSKLPTVYPRNTLRVGFISWIYFAYSWQVAGTRDLPGKLRTFFYNVAEIPEIETATVPYDPVKLQAKHCDLSEITCITRNTWKLGNASEAISVCSSVLANPARMGPNVA